MAAGKVSCRRAYPERVLQADRQGREALASQLKLGVLPGGIGQNEVIEPVIKGLTRDAHAQIAHVGEVRKRLLAGDMVLTEDHLPIRPMLGGPGTDPAF
jgi:hypothetical protein